MPKINIRESDNTKPGSGAGYANFSVLIAGPRGDANPDTSTHAKADDNGVYEFTSQAKFVDTIGINRGTNSSGTYYNRGNRMAYELLGLGYTVIYKPFDSEIELNTRDFWEPFYDKASYDFRFVSHGCLEPAPEMNKYIAALATYKAAANDLDEKDPESGRGDCIALIECPHSRYSSSADSSVPTTREVISEATRSCNPHSLINFDGNTIKIKGEVTSAATDHYITYDFSTPVLGKQFSVECLGTEMFYQELTITLSGYEIDCNNCKNIKMDDGQPVTATVTLSNLTPNNTTSTDAISNMVINKIEIMLPFAFVLNTDIFVSITPSLLVETAVSTVINNPSTVLAGIINYANSAINNSATEGTYCAMTVPSVTYKMPVSAYNWRTDNNAELDPNASNEFPGAFHYLACFKNSLDRGFAEWYAAAGYTRGYSNYVVDHTAIKLGEKAIQALEPRNNLTGLNCAVNVLACFRGSYYLWGNRTMHQLGKELTAQHFLNIRQLCTTIKKQLYTTSRALTFDPNSDLLWTNFCASVRPMLSRMVADQGIKDYKLEKVYTDKKATLKAKIRIIPIEAVEDFILEVSLEDTFGDVTLSVAE